MSRNDQEDWNRLVNEGLAFEGGSNTRFPFAVMSKKFGKVWIDYLMAAWKSNEGCLSESLRRGV